MAARNLVITEAELALRILAGDVYIEEWPPVDGRTNNTLMFMWERWHVWNHGWGHVRIVKCH